MHHVIQVTYVIIPKLYKTQGMIMHVPPQHGKCHSAADISRNNLYTKLKMRIGDLGVLIHYHTR